jgi:hypothetical protein
MKYCPQCNKQYSEAWLTFCTNDGSLLREDLTPPADPNWDPRVRETRVDDPSEQSTQWLPRDSPAAGGWIAPDERAPIERPWQPPQPVARPWEPPPPPPQPHVKPPPPGLATASFVVGLVSLMFGWFCGVPVPGIMAVILGAIALTQMRQAPNSTGRGLAIAGIAMGAISMAFFIFGLLFFILSAAFG